MKKALIVIDYINDICHPDGKLAAKGYVDFITQHNTIWKVNSHIHQFREAGNEIIFVKVAFQSWYSDQPKHSPLFWKAHEFWVLEINTWGTDFLEDLDITDTDTQIVKNRVSAFCSNLDEYLKRKNIEEIYLMWCATDLAVENTAREAHDKDYIVHVISAWCAAANIEDHTRALDWMQKIAHII